MISFGLPPERTDARGRLYRQARILYDGPPSPAFVVDLDRGSEPTQVLVALLPPEKTLAATLISMEKKIRTGAAIAPALGARSILVVPEVIWDLTHHFEELEGHTLLNPALKRQSIDVAQEDIAFRLDRAGAQVKAESKIYMRGMNPPSCWFDRPFLIVMRKRGETTPYFVMWVDNAELLKRWP